MTNTHVFRFLNPLLIFVAAFSVALTLYCCTKYYAYLPTSDTWAYADFLAQAAQGHLDVAQLFQRHNGLHIIALPKLVYFFDMWLTRGSGALTVVVSLLAMIATTAMFVTMIVRNSSLDKSEKGFLSSFCIIVLMSACQIESLLNPANLQWSLLVFSATLTAWFACRYQLAQRASGENAIALAGTILGVVLSSLTSASIFLILIPIVLLYVPKKSSVRGLIALVILALITLLVTGLFFRQHFPLMLGLLKNALVFVADFLVPPVERLHSVVASVLAMIVVLAGWYRLLKSPTVTTDHTPRFFQLLILFSLVTIVSSGIVRSINDDAFTFRFVNVGLLFAAALLPLLWMSEPRKSALCVISLLYAALLASVSVTEASAFAYGRNHIRLTQVAQALDINDPFVVATMPGTVWEKPDFDFVQSHKHLLRDVQAGVYSSEEYQRVGTSIDTLETQAPVVCETWIIKVRRLLPTQPGWRVWGYTRGESGKIISRIYFVDSQRIIRGYAIPIEPGKNLLADLFLPDQWAGFVNLEASAKGSDDQYHITLYGYDKQKVCRGEIMDLPDYAPSVKINRYEK